MRRGLSGPSRMRRVVLVVALAALLGHVCALEIEAVHWPIEHTRSTETVPAHRGADTPDLHVASCDGVKPTSTGPLVSTIENRPMPARLARIWSRAPLAAAPLFVPRPALFILHASLLI